MAIIPQLENEYKARINRAFDYIEQNIERPLTLDDLAAAANFSKFHFSRIFQAWVGETPFQFINRLRLEKAASLIGVQKDSSISEIATKCGFTDISIFSRNFKNYFKISASEFRKKNLGEIKTVVGSLISEEEKPSIYFCRESNSLKWKSDFEMLKSAEVKIIPKMTLAYVRHTGAYKGNGKLFERLWNKLFTWAGPRGLIGGPDFKALTVYHDNPNITEEDKLRTSVCITIPPDTRVDGEIGKMEFEGGNHLVAHFELNVKDYEQAWGWVYGNWLPNSGYQPDDKPCFEICYEHHNDGRFIVDICVPVKPL